MTIQTKIVDNHYIIYHGPVKTKSVAGNDVGNDLRLLDGLLFNLDYLFAQKKVYRQVMGRGPTYFFKHGQQDWVLRHYWRGGLVGKLNADFYFWNPFQNKKIQLQKTRAYQEFALLLSLNELKLPAPVPIAARISYSFLGYRADIITQTLANTQSLVQSLTKNMTASIWFDIGMTIEKFHRYNIYHDDLNANNILIDGNNKIFIIDFDKGKIISDRAMKSNEWKKQNLERLLRSLNKEKAKNTHLYFTNDNWKSLIKGYLT